MHGRKQQKIESIASSLAQLAQCADAIAAMCQDTKYSIVQNVEFKQ